MASQPLFVLVPIGCGGAITDMDKFELQNLTGAQFQRVYNALQSCMKGNGGCEAVIWYDNGSRDGAFAWSRNTPMEHHAEENLFLQQNATTLTIKAALITIEPCRGHHYGTNHNCFEFFKGGRKVTERLRTFVAAGPNTPVFYYEKQPAPGVTSDFSRSLARLDRQYLRDYLAHLGGGVQWGLPFFNPSTGLWAVGGQRAMTAVEIFESLERFNKYKPLDADKWNPEFCTEDVEAEVKRRLSAWASQFKRAKGRVLIAASDLNSAKRADRKSILEQGRPSTALDRG